MKTPSTFKLSKRNKTLIALLPFKTEEQRNAFKRNMIQAQYISSISERHMMGVNAKGKDE
jgi:hypothetical protein